MDIDPRLIKGIMNHPIREEFLIGENIQNRYMITKPHVDLKIDANIDWDNKCASLSIQFKLFLI